MKRIIVFSILVLFVSGFLVSQDIKYDINKPDSSSNWAKGSEKTITWNNKGDTWPEVKIKLFNFPAMTKALDIDSNIANNGSYLWKIPNAGLSVGKYVVRVKTTDDNSWGNSAPFNIIVGTLAFGVPDDVLKIKKKKPKFKPSKGMFNPKIVTAFNYWAGPLKPGQKVILEGKLFGKNKGNVYLKGNFPNGKLHFEELVWISDTKISGKIPMSSNGIANHDVKIVLVTSLNFKSNEWPAKFEGREEKLLTKDAIGVSCGNDGNCNQCNDTRHGCDGLLLGDDFSRGCSNEYSICGYHRNNTGAIGDDSGDDIYYINLKNGWVLKSIHIEEWHKSSGDEVLTGPSPPFPAGQSIWNGVVTWKVTQGDNVFYSIKIMVEGPIGTSYK